MKKLLFCTHKVNKANIKRESRDGVEHVVLTSYTLPPNIVMNGGLYPSEEVDKSFETLNRTPVTVEHPELNGVFVSANDPEIDFDFRFGAFNENARKIEDGRIALDKVINVQKALKTEKGKRLLDRIEEVETNEQARPIHTSVGVFLEAEETEIKTNERGQEYSWIAKNMVFDHDAILLDSIGASTPDQGTGINVNKEGVSVEHYVCSTKKVREVIAENYLINNELSFSDIERKLWDEVNRGQSLENQSYIVAVYEYCFILQTKENQLFKQYYKIENNTVDISGARIAVERVTEYKPLTTENEEDSIMRDSIIAELKALGVAVNAEISDGELMTEYKKALSVNADSESDVSSVVADAVKAAIEPLSAELTELKSNMKTSEDKELEELAAQVVNSGKYQGIDTSDIKSLGLDKAKAMAANCGIAHGIGSTMQVNEVEQDTFKTNLSDLPE